MGGRCARKPLQIHAGERTLNAFAFWRFSNHVVRSVESEKFFARSVQSKAVILTLGLEVFFFFGSRRLSCPCPTHIVMVSSLEGVAAWLVV